MKKISLSKIFFNISLLLILIIQTYPIFWIFSSSLKSPGDFSDNMPFQLPSGFHIQNYLDAIKGGNIFSYFRNSTIVAVISIITILVLSSAAGFAIEKLKFRINKLVLSLFLCGIMIPIQVTLIPLFQIYREIGIINTYLCLILPQVGFALPISIYLFVGFFKYLPNEIMEAAIIDGCDIYKTFLRIIIPMSKNIIITVITMNVIFIWNDFIFANTFISKTSMKTLPVGLYDYIGNYGLTNWGATFAAMTITTLPTVILYFILNKSVISGMTAGAVKG